MSTATLTPQNNQAPAVVSTSKELSGFIWTTRFPGSISISALVDPFRTNVTAFFAAIHAAGGHTMIANTFRPVERSYMMHCAHKVFRNGFDPAHLPTLAGVEIEWVHPTLAQSVEGARQMVYGMDMQGLGVNLVPPLHSLHNVRRAIDVKIWWDGTLVICNRDGSQVSIDTLPRSGMNLQLKEVGLTWGVKKFHGGATDRPHWSDTGY